MFWPFRLSFSRFSVASHPFALGVRPADGDMVHVEGAPSKSQCWLLWLGGSRKAREKCTEAGRRRAGELLTHGLRTHPTSAVSAGSPVRGLRRRTRTEWASLRLHSELAPSAVLRASSEHRRMGQACRRGRDERRETNDARRFTHSRSHGRDARRGWRLGRCAVHTLRTTLHEIRATSDEGRATSSGDVHSFGKKRGSGILRLTKRRVRIH